MLTRRVGRWQKSTVTTGWTGLSSQEAEYIAAASA